jgi:hypothetical protein
LTLLTTLAFLGFSVTVAAHPCDRAPGHKHCDSDPGGGGSSVVYTAELISGAFNFRTEQGALGEVSVTPISMGNELVGNVGLGMYPGDGALPGIWNEVFNTCVELLALNSVTYFHVEADDWSIEKPGGVRVIFRDIVLQNAVVTVQLMGSVSFNLDWQLVRCWPGATLNIAGNYR